MALSRLAGTCIGRGSLYSMGMKMMSGKRRKRRRGQATAEVVIGLVGLTVLFFGLVQIAQLGHENIENLIKARSEAEKKAIGLFGSQAEDDYVGNWEDGPDGLRFTADDTRRPGINSLVVFTNELTEPLSLEGTLDGLGLGGYDGFSGYLEDDSIALAADLRKASASRLVPVEPALQKLLLKEIEALVLRDEVYMPNLDLTTGGP